MISAMGPDLQDYDRMGAALALIEARFPEPVALGELAAAVGLSPHHFQRVFRRWAGISPKRFQQYLALERAKDALAQSQSVLDAAFCVNSNVCFSPAGGPYSIIAHASYPTALHSAITGPKSTIPSPG